MAKGGRHFTFKKKATACGSLLKSCLRGSLDDCDTFVLVKFLKQDLDDLALLRRHKLADVIRLNRKFVMLFATIN